MGGLWGDIRYAVRTLARAPTFTLVAVLTLGLGIGANTAVFSVVDGVLLSALPYDAPDDLVTVWLDLSARDGAPREWLTPPDLEDLRQEPGLFEEIGGWGAWNPTLTGVGEPEVMSGAVITEGTFGRVLRTQPFLGRTFMPEEDRPGAAGVVLVSHGFWRDRLGADPGALGRPLILDEQPFSIVGVMPEGFTPPFVPAAQLWRPAALDAARCPRGCFAVRAIGRLEGGVSLGVARARADALASRLAEAYPTTNADVGVALAPLHDELVGPAARALWVLLGAVGFVLLIACTNVANLLLARGAAREGEFAVRSALGAGRTPILRQLLVESLLLAALGGMVGLSVAAWGTSALVEMAPVYLPGLANLSWDARVLAFTAAVTLGTGFLFGFLPALRTSRADVSAGLAPGRAGRSLGRHLRGGLAVTQVALAMVLLVGAGLLIRSFQRLNTADLGFDPEGVLAVSIALPPSRFAGAASRVTFFRELIERLESVPGVLSVAAASALPLAGNDGDADFRIEGRPPPAPPDAHTAWVRPISGAYFYTVGLRLLDGRVFEEADDDDATPVVIVNETLAARHFDFPRRSPVGERIALGTRGNPSWRTVVGVAADTRHFGIRESARPAVYLPYAQLAFTTMSVVLRTDGDPLSLGPDVRAAVAELDPTLAASTIVPLKDQVAGTLVTERFLTRVLAIFASLALTLAAVGLYGVVSYGVTRRMREVGIRMALGASGHDVRRRVVGSGVGLTAVGVALGTVAALALTGVLEALLYRVSVTDPLTFGVMVGALGLVAVLASWLPAQRAGGADPVTVLREE